MSKSLFKIVLSVWSGKASVYVFNNCIYFSVKMLPTYLRLRLSDFKGIRSTSKCVQLLSIFENETFIRTLKKKNLITVEH